MTYRKIILEVLKSENKKMTTNEIWSIAEKKGFIDMLDGNAKNLKIFYLHSLIY